MRRRRRYRSESVLDRWSLLCKVNDRWHVYVPTDEAHTVTTRPVRWSSPRDLIRFPLHWWWVRRYW